MALSQRAGTTKVTIAVGCRPAECQPHRRVGRPEPRVACVHGSCSKTPGTDRVRLTQEDPETCRPDQADAVRCSCHTQQGGATGRHRPIDGRGTRWWLVWVKPAQFADQDGMDATVAALSDGLVVSQSFPLSRAKQPEPWPSVAPAVGARIRSSPSGAPAFRWSAALGVRPLTAIIASRAQGDRWRGRHRDRRCRHPRPSRPFARLDASDERLDRSGARLAREGIARPRLARHCVPRTDRDTSDRQPLLGSASPWVTGGSSTDMARSSRANSR